MMDEKESDQLIWEHRMPIIKTNAWPIPCAQKIYNNAPSIFVVNLYSIQLQIITSMTSMQQGHAVKPRYFEVPRDMKKISK